MTFSRRGFLRGIFSVAACVALGQRVPRVVAPAAPQVFTWRTDAVNIHDLRFTVAARDQAARAAKTLDYITKQVWDQWMRSVDPCTAAPQRGLEGMKA